MRRIWHPYWNWEDYHAGMWRKLPRHEEPPAFDLAKQFTGNAELYGKWMLEAIRKFPVACEHNLTDRSLNKQAWIGHAACALAHKLPEYIVRKAWATLSEVQRIEANKKADYALRTWQSLFRGDDGRQLSFDF